MAIAFPSNPVNNQSFTSGTRTWVYDSTKEAWFGGNIALFNFGSIEVSGQNTVVADVQSDILTLATGSGISITTDMVTDTITISKNETVNSITGSRSVGRDTINLISTTSGSVNITLPSAVSPSRVTVKKITSDGNTITVLPLSGTIDGDSSIQILYYNSAMTVVSNGANWFLI